tara:strand:- start:1279 stop:1644 length:366 start_codon:yes stop_codon:yes gene_type:complete
MKNLSSEELSNLSTKELDKHYDTQSKMIYTIGILTTVEAYNMLRYGEDIMNVKHESEEKIANAINKEYLKFIELDSVEFVINLKTEDGVCEYKRKLWTREMIIDFNKETIRQSKLTKMPNF